MRDIKSLKRLHRLTQREEQEQTVILARQLKEQREALAQLDQLEQYRVEYSADPQRSQNFSLSAYKNRQHFLSKLSEAIQQQQQQTELIEENLKPSYKKWILAKNRREAIEGAVHEARREENDRLDNQQQKDADIYSSQIRRSALNIKL